MVKKQQLILVSGSAILFFLIFFFGKTVPPRKISDKPAAAAQSTITYDDIIANATKKLTAPQQAYVTSLRSAVVRGDVKDQQVKVYRQLADFWKDSVRLFEPYAFYLGEAAKLENSEKSLTFAARLFLDNLRGAEDPALKTLLANSAKSLFEKALEINPNNDSSKVGLGSCYIFGSSASNPQEVMQGIQQILQVVRKDSNNMYAQMMLGIGGVVSGQTDKAIERLTKVVEHEPRNLEAVLTLADAYERKADNANAVRWYKEAKKLIVAPQVLKELDERINQLK
jgi:tetratricopeptide (TPR) repeat protein